MDHNENLAKLSKVSSFDDLEKIYDIEKLVKICKSYESNMIYRLARNAKIKNVLNRAKQEGWY